MARSTSLEDTANLNQRFLGNICLSSERWTNIEGKNQIPIKIKSIYQTYVVSFFSCKIDTEYICTTEIVCSFTKNLTNKK